jgi:hypothetical protein
LGTSYAYVLLSHIYKAILLKHGFNPLWITHIQQPPLCLQEKSKLLKGHPEGLGMYSVVDHGFSMCKSPGTSAREMSSLYTN